MRSVEVMTDSRKWESAVFPLAFAATLVNKVSHTIVLETKRLLNQMMIQFDEADWRGE